MDVNEAELCCLKCGYPVGRTPDVSQCSECGLAVSVSRAWFERHVAGAMRLGSAALSALCRRLGWSLLVLFVLLPVVVIGMLVYLAQLIMSGGEPDTAAYVVLVVGPALLLVEHGLWLWGMGTALPGLPPTRRGWLIGFLLLHGAALLTAVGAVLASEVLVLLYAAVATCAARAAALLLIGPPLVRGLLLARVRRLGIAVAITGGLLALNFAAVAVGLVLGHVWPPDAGLSALALSAVWGLSLPVGVLLLAAARRVSRAG